jgi:hypothetical protein
MKHLKTFEKVRDKDIPKMKINNAMSKYIPGAYIVFYKNFYNWENRCDNKYLFFGRIRNCDLYNNEEVGCYINVIEYNSEYKTTDFKSPEAFNIERNFDKIIISTSFKNTQDKYIELSEKMEIERTTNKYNL